MIAAPLAIMLTLRLVCTVPNGTESKDGRPVIGVIWPGQNQIFAEPAMVNRIESSIRKATFYDKYARSILNRINKIFPVDSLVKNFLCIEGRPWVACRRVPHHPIIGYSRVRNARIILANFSIIAGRQISVIVGRCALPGRINNRSDEVRSDGARRCVAGVPVRNIDWNALVWVANAPVLTTNYNPGRSDPGSIRIRNFSIFLFRNVGLSSGLGISEKSTRSRANGTNRRDAADQNRQSPISPLLPAMLFFFGVPASVRGWIRGPDWLLLVGYACGTAGGGLLLFWLLWFFNGGANG